MKIASKFLVAATVMLLTSAVSAGTLYWQVDDTDWDGAILFVQDTTASSDDPTALSEGIIGTPTGIQQTDVTDYTDAKYLFYVELVNYATGATKSGYKWGYGDLVSSGYVALDATAIPTVMANAAALGNFANAPEPSSGLLLLMGGAMLALRRRRQK